MSRQAGMVVDAEVTANVRMGEFSYLQLACPELAHRAFPGQFVNVQCEGLTLRRPFSIYHPLENEQGERTGIALLLKVLGPGTRYLAAREPGETVNLLGPLGHGLEDPALLGDDVVLLSGGFGIAPLDFCGSALRAAGKRVTLLHGTNALDQLPLYPGGPLPQWPVAERFVARGSDVHVASLAGEPGVFHGNVVDLLHDRLTGTPDLLTCGSQAMMRAVALAARELQLRCYVLMEEMMGCGISICRSCVCRARETGPEGERVVNRTACTDGPLLDAATLIWDA